MVDVRNFYKGKKVFLTGATGFKGSWLVLLLEKLGAEIYDYSLEPPSNPSLWELLDIKNSCAHTHADIRDRLLLKEKVLEVKPDIFIHLAAQSLVRPSYEFPFETLETNIMGTTSVLEAVKTCERIKSTLIITSDKAYENIGKAYPYKENDRMGGDDPYSASKGCAELIVYSYRKSFFDTNKQGLASVRAGNVIGGGDFAKDRLIPDMARAFTKNESVHIRYPMAIRPWQHVLEPLYGYLILAKELYNNPSSYSNAWNFGPLHNEAHTVEEVVKLFAHCWDNSEKNVLTRYTIDTRPQPHEAYFLGLDCTKVAEKLFWKPRLSFKEGIQWTSDWYKAWSFGLQDLYTLTQQQINEYLGK